MSSISVVDCLGITAALLTLTTFMQRHMVPMRAAAIGANAVFIGYGLLGGIYPVLALHLVLLPVNLARLAGELGRSGPPAPSLAGQHGSHSMCSVHASRFAPSCSLER